MAECAAMTMVATAKTAIAVNKSQNITAPLSYDKSAGQEKSLAACGGF